MSIFESDRKFLKGAAEAHGDISLEDGGERLVEKSTGHQWDPLTDDGDAERLAAKLGLEIEAMHDIGCAWALHPDIKPVNVHRVDVAAATRVAIVVAASDIAKKRSRKKLLDTRKSQQ